MNTREFKKLVDQWDPGWQYQDVGTQRKADTERRMYAELAAQEDPHLAALWWSFVASAWRRYWGYSQPLPSRLVQRRK